MLIELGLLISKGINISEGVLQGKILGPFRFAIFLSDLETFLYGRGVKGVLIGGLITLIVLGYADDLVFFAVPWDEIQYLLNCFLEFY